MNYIYTYVYFLISIIYYFVLYIKKTSDMKCNAIYYSNETIILAIVSRINC